MTPSEQLLAERDRALQAGQYGEEDLERLVGVLDSVMEQLHKDATLVKQAPNNSGTERFERYGCDCNKQGRSLSDECIYEDPCPQAAP